MQELGFVVWAAVNENQIWVAMLVLSGLSLVVFPKYCTSKCSKLKSKIAFAHQMSPIDKLIVALSCIDHVVVIQSKYYDSVE